MKVPEIRTIAKEMGIKPGRMAKADLIKSIQEAEGNFPCFGTTNGFCDQQDCQWRDDCLK